MSSFNVDHQTSTEPLPNHQSLTRELARFATLKTLYSSEFYRQHTDELQKILDTPQIFAPTTYAPPHKDFLRVACWNIERGNRFEAVLHFLKTNPLLASADVILLNEVDVGMLRTGNRHVGFELGKELGMHCFYGAEYLEMTKGIGQELELKGENTTALHGNAILARVPFKNPRILRLPTCFEPFHFQEKRFGSRIALAAELEIGSQTLVVATAHLEVRKTPHCRRVQMKAILDWLGKSSFPTIIGGDWNTNTFARGTRLKTLLGSARVLFTKPAKLQYDLRHPDEGSEKLFDELKQAGFSWSELNDDEPTVQVLLQGMEDAALLPGFLRGWISQRISEHAGQLKMRLDWLAGRNLRALRPGVTLCGLEYDGLPPSDHAPIVSDVWFKK